MDFFNPKPNNKPNNDLRQLSLLSTVPAILFAAPMVGFFVGRWADKKLGTEPYLLIAGVVLGFIAAGVETYNLVKKSSSIEKENEHDQKD
ncbi:MAG: AtpZ/AtpI family protein [FCB group bacterium]|nr:AtpZ/AtpI family protein [FCB group bacterium]